MRRSRNFLRLTDFGATIASIASLIITAVSIIRAIAIVISIAIAIFIVTAIAITVRNTVSLYYQFGSAACNMIYAIAYHAIIIPSIKACRYLAARYCIGLGYCAVNFNPLSALRQRIIPLVSII